MKLVAKQVELKFLLKKNHKFLTKRLITLYNSTNTNEINQNLSNRLKNEPKFISNFISQFHNCQ